MRKIVCGSVTALLVAMGLSSITSCSKGGDGPSAPDSVKVSLSAATLKGNGFNGVTVTVKDKNGTDVTSASQLYANGVAFSGPVYYPEYAEKVVITATKGTVPSNEAVLQVSQPDEVSPFTQKLVVEDFTGTWCGYCPRVAYNLENYISEQPACISVGVHGGGDNSDPYTYLYLNTFAANYGVTGFPWALVNHGAKWDEKAATLDRALTRWAPLGLAVESSVNGTAITGKVKVKFNLTTDVALRVVVMLVEDNLTHNQVNYYSQLGANPIVGFKHTNILRQMASSDIVNGDAIPSGTAVKGNVWEKTFSFSTTGKTGINTDYTINTANAKVVAFVQYAKINTLNRKGAINAQFANVGATKDFD